MLKKLKEKDIFSIILVAVFIIYILAVVLNAWLGDDAYISFRVVKNLVSGNGMVWNPGQRVQVFTNPLMVLLLSGISFFAKEIFFTAIFFNIITSAIAVYILLFKICKDKKVAIFLGVLLILGKSFVAFSTSGLENCLTFLFLSLFYYFFFKYETYNKKQLFILGLISSLILLNRLDSILLVIPALFYAFFIKKEKSISIIKSILVGIASMVPFIIWEIFSFIYFGYLVPNTYYAKMNSGYPAIDYIVQGLKYFVANILLDPIVVFVILIAIVLVFLRKIDIKTKLLSFSIMISCLYIIKVGGDFMMARFLTPAFLVAIIALSRLEYKGRFKLVGMGVVTLMIIVGFTLNTYALSKNYDTLHDGQWGYAGVIDEQKWYFENSSLIKNWGEDGIRNSLELGFKPGKKAQLVGAIGYSGYFNNDIIIIDYMGLGDPLLSHLPGMGDTIYRIGHVKRIIPTGYEESVETGINVINDPGLHEYYDKVKIITEGKIFTKERFKTIINMNLGKYEDLLKNYK